jgi:hypothetical protein
MLSAFSPTGLVKIIPEIVPIKKCNHPKVIALNNYLPA